MYFSQLQAGKLRSAILSWDKPMTFGFQLGTGNESLQWKFWRLRTTVTYRTWCCILNIALEKVFLQNFRCSTDTKLAELYRINENTDTKTDCSHLKAFLVGFLNCDLSRALSHSSFRWNCIHTLSLPAIYFYSYASYIARLTYGIWN